MTVWKKVTKLDSVFEISDDGRLRRISYEVNARGGKTRVIKAREVKLGRHQFGYPVATISFKGVRHTLLIHQLMAEAFIGPRPEGLVVRHLDDNPENNTVGNLAYGTPGDNQKDKERNGNQPVGEGIPWSRMTAKCIEEIRLRRACGDSLLILANSYGISEAYVWKICSGAVWKSAPGPITKRVRIVQSLTDLQRKEALEMRERGGTISFIAEHFGVSRTQIHNLVRQGK